MHCRRGCRNSMLVYGFGNYLFFWRVAMAMVSLPDAFGVHPVVRVVKCIGEIRCTPKAPFFCHDHGFE